MIRIAIARALASMLLVAFASPHAGAQDAFPSKPVRILVPWPPAGPPDLMARLIAPRMAEQLGRPVVVENRAGATGTIGTDVVAKSGPDGHTLLLTSNQPLVIAPAMFRTPYDPARDLTPVASLTEDMIAMVVNSSLGVSTVGELVAMAKANPGKLSYATAGNGSMGHLGAELLKQVVGIDMVHVPYQGIAPATTAVVSGEVAVGFPPVQQAGPHIKSGKLKPLGVTGQRPTPYLPDVQPLVAQGLNGVVVTSWVAAMLPPKTPRPIVVAWRDALQKSMDDAGVRQKLQDAGIQVQWQEAEPLAAMLQADLAKWRKVIATAKITAN